MDGGRVVSALHGSAIAERHHLHGLTNLDWLGRSVEREGVGQVEPVEGSN